MSGNSSSDVYVWDLDRIMSSPFIDLFKLGLESHLHVLVFTSNLIQK